MMKRVVLLWISILFLVVRTPQLARAADREVLLGTVYKETSFAFPKLSSKEPRLTPEVVLLQSLLQVKTADSYSPTEYRFQQFVADNRPYRWRIVRDIFWGNGSAGVRHFGLDVMRIPIEDLALVDPSNPKRKEQYLAKFPKDTVYQKAGYPNALAWDASPVSDVCYRHPLGRGDILQPPGDKAPIPTPGVFFDAYPIASDRIMLFVIDGDTLRVWSGTTKDKWVGYWRMDWGKDDKESESFKSPLKEAFTVFVRDKDYYFVTESGDIYLAKAVDKGQRKVEKVWDGKRQPVHALITDASNDKVYCFVEPSAADKDEERVYFELSAKPEPTKYQLKKIEKPKIAEPLKSVLEYAHVLQADKKIK
jgi:hypothetical protein